MKELDYDERYEDYLAIVEPYFELDPFINWEVDLHYAQGEM